MQPGVQNVSKKIGFKPNGGGRGRGLDWGQVVMSEKICTLLHALHRNIYANGIVQVNQKVPKLLFFANTTIVKGLSNLKLFRIKIILKRILLKDETKNI